MLVSSERHCIRHDDNDIAHVFLALSSSQSISVDLFVKWIEPRLNITDSTIEAIKDQLILDKSWDKKIWCPSIFFKNGIRGDMYLEKSPMSYYEILYNKTIQMTQRYSVFYSF